MRQAAAIFAIGFAIGLAGCSPGVAEPDLDHLQALATQACHCEYRDGGDSKACRAKLEEAMGGLAQAEWSTACDPVSKFGTCLGESDNACITGGYRVNSASQPTVVCTAEEAQAVEAAYSNAYGEIMAANGFPGPPEWSVMNKAEEARRSAANSKADLAGLAAIEDVIARIKRGEKFASNQSPQTCLR